MTDLLFNNQLVRLLEFELFFYFKPIFSLIFEVNFALVLKSANATSPDTLNHFRVLKN
jgi:hypothetical protein